MPKTKTIEKFLQNKLSKLNKTYLELLENNQFEKANSVLSEIDIIEKINTNII